MDCIVRSWLHGTLSSDLVDIVMARSTQGATARSTWLAIEAQFIGNKEARALHLDARFRTFVQGDLSITDYCKRFKCMADDLANLGEVVADRTLVLNVLCGLNKKYASIGRHLRRSRPFPSFLEVCDDLILEEITLSNQATTPSTALLAGTTSSQRSPAPSQRPSGRSNSGSGGGKGSGGGRRQRRLQQLGVQGRPRQARKWRPVLLWRLWPQQPSRLSASSRAPGAVALLLQPLDRHNSNVARI